MNSKWFNNVKKKVVWCNDVLVNTYSPKERLPPRLNLRGISVAARVVGKEIRDVTKRMTGKDLASLRNNKTRNDIINIMTDFKYAFTNEESKQILLNLACSHSINFALSLSPEGADYSKVTTANNIVLRRFIANYYKDCLQSDLNSPKSKILSKVAQAREKKPVKNVVVGCSCGSSNQRDLKRYTGCWVHDGIPEERLDRYYADNMTHFSSNDNKFNLCVSGDWVEFTRILGCTAFRRKLPNGLHEYRVQASFDDVSANDLFATQIDGEYRKTWDKYVLTLNVLDLSKEASSELIHWVTKCPYPFATREYIYLRRQKVDHKKKVLLLYQTATSHSKIPRDDNVQRVEVYESKIAIKPHSHDFDEKGCDFLLTYHDDPKMMLPARLIDIAASRGICESTDRMHKAALHRCNVKNTADKN